MLYMRYSERLGEISFKLLEYRTGGHPWLSKEGWKPRSFAG